MEKPPTKESFGASLTLTLSPANLPALFPLHAKYFISIKEITQNKYQAIFKVNDLTEIDKIFSPSVNTVNKKQLENALESWFTSITAQICETSQIIDPQDPQEFINNKNQIKQLDRIYTF